MHEERTSSNAAPRMLNKLLAAAALDFVGRGAAPDPELTTLTDDSRAVTPGACFVAVRGAKSDGHDFLPAAIRAGAVAVVVDRDVPCPAGVTCIRVSDSRVALARLSAAWYGLAGRDSVPRLIGVTGTNGKTTVTWMLRSILQAAECPTALLGTIENDLLGERQTSPLTTPGALALCRSLAQARERGAQRALVEVSSHALDQRRCDGLSFEAAVFTNLTGDHLDYHKTMDAYFSAKRRLFETLEPSAVAVINLDDPRGASLARAGRATVVGFGLESPDARVRATIRSMDRTGTVAEIRGIRASFPIELALIGRHNVLNALAAAATAESIGISPDAIRAGLENLRGVPGRLQRAEPRDWPYSVFVDYAHTDDALRNVLTALRPLTEGRLRCVFGCGGDRDRTKRPRMAAAVEALGDVAYVTSDNPRNEDPHAIVEEIRAGFAGDRRCRVVVEVDRRRAIELALSDAGEGDTVLIAGKGHENYQIIGGQTLPFDDVGVARDWMTAVSVQREVA